MAAQVDPAAVARRLADVRRRLLEITDRSVSVVAVTKSFGVEAVDAAVAAGCDAIGENYAQELLAKAPSLPEGTPVHFIGRLQSNKVRSLVGVVDVWESVDRGSLADEIARRHAGRPARVLLQVNTTGEDSKGGCEPERLADLLARAKGAGLAVEGLMTIGPTGGDADACRSAFRRLRLLADEHGLEHCSMGMSDDWEVAAAEGATIVRLGSALFGSRA